MPARIIFPEKGKVKLEHYESPVLAQDDVRVRTYYSLMSPGTEGRILYRDYEPGSHFARMFSFPQLKTGVQAIGEVIEKGAKVDEFAAGDIVYMREAHGSEQVLPAAACSPVPAGIDQRSACWCGLAKTAFRAAWAGAFDEASDIVIVGAGPVGQMTLRWGAVSNARNLAIVDLSESRLQHAKRGGASLVLQGDIAECRSQLQSINDGEGPALVIDTTGSAAVFQPALSLCARYGKLLLLGDTGFPSEQRLSSSVMEKGLTIQATHDSHDRDGWDQRRIDARFFTEVQAGNFRLDGLITHEFKPSDCVEAYALVSDTREKTMGVLFDWTLEDYSSC